MNLDRCTIELPSYVIKKTCPLNEEVNMIHENYVRNNEELRYEFSKQ